MQKDLPYGGGVEGNEIRRHLQIYYCVSKKQWPIFIVIYYIKWVTTSWTYSTILAFLNMSKSQRQGTKVQIFFLLLKMEAIFSRFFIGFVVFLTHCVGNWYKKWWNGQVWLRVGLECPTHAPVQSIGAICFHYRVADPNSVSPDGRIRFFRMVGPGYLFRSGSSFSLNTKKIKILINLLTMFIDHSYNEVMI